MVDLPAVSSKVTHVTQAQLQAHENGEFFTILHSHVTKATAQHLQSCAAQRSTAAAALQLHLHLRLTPAR